MFSCFFVCLIILGHLPNLYFISLGVGLAFLQIFLSFFGDSTKCLVLAWTRLLVHSRVRHCPVFIFMKVVSPSVVRVCLCACPPSPPPLHLLTFHLAVTKYLGETTEERKIYLGSQFQRDFSPFWWARPGVGMVLSVKVGNFKGGLFTRRQAEKTDQHQKQRPAPGDRPTAEAPQTSEYWHELGRRCSKQNPGNLIRIALLSCPVAFSIGDSSCLGQKAVEGKPLACLLSASFTGPFLDCPSCTREQS